MSHPEHDEHEFSPLATVILDGLAEQYETVPGKVIMLSDSMVHANGPFDVEELATFVDQTVARKVEDKLKADLVEGAAHYEPTPAPSPLAIRGVHATETGETAVRHVLVEFTDDSVVLMRHDQARLILNSGARGEWIKEEDPDGE